MKKSAIFVMLCLAVLLTGMVRADVVVSNFEDNAVDGWFNYAGNPIAVIAAPALPGLGNYSLEETVTNPYWGQITAQSWANATLNTANLNASQSIDMDLVFPSANWLPSWANLQLEVQDGGGSLGTQTNSFYLNLTGLTKDAITPVSFPISSILPLDPTANFVNLSLWVQPGYDPAWGTYTAKVDIDNVTLVVPEPATLVLLAMSGLMALLYWRKR
ncbi:MAG: PEP-CTERM sorting domain-containing protein [Thermoguttaceae bacterium]|jgi:hypothetical protein